MNSTIAGILTIVFSVLFIIGFWFIIIWVIKHIIKFTAKTIYEEKEKAHQKYNKKDDAKKPFTQADFERWKQNKGGFIDLDAEVSLPWRKAT